MRANVVIDRDGHTEESVSSRESQGRRSRGTALSRAINSAVDRLDRPANTHHRYIVLSLIHRPEQLETIGHSIEAWRNL